jgi:hypothetical protein
MKTLVGKKQTSVIHYSDLTGNELIAYRCQNSDAYAVLAKLGGGGTYGFVPLNNSNSKPRYIDASWFGSVQLAMGCRDLMVFDNMEEMITCMINRSF